MPIKNLTFNPSTNSQQQFVDCMKEFGIELPMDFLVKTYNTSLQDDAFITLMSGDKVLKHSAMMTLTALKEGFEISPKPVPIKPYIKREQINDKRIIRCGKWLSAIRKGYIGRRTESPFTA